MSESPLQPARIGIGRVSRTGVTLALSLAMMLWCGIAQGAPRKAAPPAAPEGKTVRDAKAVPPPAQPPAPRRLLTFNERFYPGAIRSFTTWW
jgi:hypothetical protein